MQLFTDSCARRQVNPSHTHPLPLSGCVCNMYLGILDVQQVFDQSSLLMATSSATHSHAPRLIRELFRLQEMVSTGHKKMTMSCRDCGKPFMDCPGLCFILSDLLGVVELDLWIARHSCNLGIALWRDVSMCPDWAAIRLPNQASEMLECGKMMKPLCFPPQERRVFF